MRTVYKAVLPWRTIEPGHLVEYVSLNVTGDARVAYKVGEPVRPPEYLWERGYGLCVFDTLENAKAWLCEIPNAVPLYGVLWEADAKNVFAPPAPLVWSSMISRHSTDFVQSDAEWPTGTLMCETLRLRNEITAW